MNNPFSRRNPEPPAASSTTARLPKQASVRPSLMQASPHAVDAGPPVQATSPDRNVTGLLVGIYSAMLVFAFTIYEAVSTAMARPPEHSTACREDEPNTCGEGRYCNAGVCDDEGESLCIEGAACDSCLCEHPRTCGTENLCKLPVLPPPVCNDDLKALVKQLVDFQKGCVAKAGGELSACPTANVKDFMLAHTTFDSLLKDFPSGLTIMFPGSQPAISQEDGAAWPDPVTLENYEKAITEHAGAFKDAKYIVLVGRASRGRAAENYAYAQARVRFARERLLDALSKKNLERGEVSKKFIEFAIGNEQPLHLEFFSMMYRHPTIWWDKNANRELEGARKKINANKTLGVVERSRSEQILNRSVVAFAIPAECVEG